MESHIRLTLLHSILLLSSSVFCVDQEAKPSESNQKLLGKADTKEDIVKLRRRCPVCDTSVFPYCSEKLLHDACCCLNPEDTPLPYQCSYADCSFLHANSCQEHKLITACCCNRHYFYLARN